MVGAWKISLGWLFDVWNFTTAIIPSASAGEKPKNMEWCCYSYGHQNEVHENSNWEKNGRLRERKDVKKSAAKHYMFTSGSNKTKARRTKMKRTEHT